MRLVFIGASGHGKVCAEVAEMNGYSEILFLDDNRELKECGNYPVVGVEADFEKFMDENTGFFVSIGNAKTRKRIQEEIMHSNGRFVTLIHPDAVVSKNVKIGVGTIIMAGVVINSGTVISKGVIVNTSSSIDHDCEIAEYSHIAVGAHLCGGVRIGVESWIGVGAVVNNNLDICEESIVGAGAAVVKAIKEAGTYIGVPARKKV